MQRKATENTEGLNLVFVSRAALKDAILHVYFAAVWQPRMLSVGRGGLSFLG
jgi:hypothetical protein